MAQQGGEVELMKNGYCNYYVKSGKFFDWLIKENKI